MEKIDARRVSLLFQSVANKFSEKKDELCEMDAKMGDGDLGLTMERVLTAAFAPGEEKNSILEMLEAEFAGCDAANQTLDAEFPVRDWELNPSGTLQGGLLTSMMDMVMRLL